MKLWKISQHKNNKYDTYDSAVVAADTEEDAVKIHPSDYADSDWYKRPEDRYGDWVSVESVTVEYIGEAKEGILSGVIVASFNAG